jgi:glycosyltransferase involved in cell wall biosynthesis
VHRRDLHAKMEEDCEAPVPVKILIVWSGARVPAYRRFFLELARSMTVRALGPRKWTHGSVEKDAGDAPDLAPDCEILPAAFLPRGSSRALVPALPWHLWTFRPRYLYLMEEMDRLSLLVHALAAKVCWPPVRIVTYSLQNLPRPSYYRRRHALALRLNALLVHKAVAASREAHDVLRHHGFRGEIAIIPLWASEDAFRPASADEREDIRRSLGILPGEMVLCYAGGLVEAKGLSLLKEVLPRFPRLRLVAAGRGPLEPLLREALGRQFIPLGPLDGEDLARFYRAGDFVILPSLTLPGWKEQIGRALIEGVMSGCIALGSDSGYIPELTIFAETTFRQGDAESLAALLGRLPLADSDSIRAAQIENVRQRFTAAAVAKATAEFLLPPKPRAVGLLKVRPGAVPGIGDLPALDAPRTGARP